MQLLKNNMLYINWLNLKKFMRKGKEEEQSTKDYQLGLSNRYALFPSMPANLHTWEQFNQQDSMGLLLKLMLPNAWKLCSS